jgi:hypothetical protein
MVSNNLILHDWIDVIIQETVDFEPWQLLNTTATKNKLLSWAVISPNTVLEYYDTNSIWMTSSEPIKQSKMYLTQSQCLNVTTQFRLNDFLWTNQTVKNVSHPITVLECYDTNSIWMTPSEPIKQSEIYLTQSQCLNVMTQFRLNDSLWTNQTVKNVSHPITVLECYDTIPFEWLPLNQSNSPNMHLIQSQCLNIAQHGTIHFPLTPN